jgi:hypothetical protein
MWEDLIAAEVRQVRATHAAQFNNDLSVIFRNLKIEEQQSDKFTSYPARHVIPVKKGPVEAVRLN